MVEQQTEKRKRGRPPGKRKGNGTSSAPILSRGDLAKKNETLDLMNEKTRAYQIYKLMLQGYTIQDVAEKLCIEEATVDKLVSLAVQQADKSIASLATNYVSMSIARLEVVIRGYMVHIAKDVQEENILDHRSAKELRDTIRLEGEILGVFSAKKDSGAGSTTVNVNNTIIGGSDLYKRGLAEMQIEQFGDTIYPDSAILDPRIKALDDALPDGLS